MAIVNCFNLIQVVAYMPEMSSDNEQSKTEKWCRARRQLYHDAWRVILQSLIECQGQGGFLFDGKLYFPSEEGVIHVIQPSKRFRSIAQNEMGERTFATIVPTDGTLFIRGEEHLWRIEN